MLLVAGGDARRDHIIRVDVGQRRLGKGRAAYFESLMVSIVRSASGGTSIASIALDGIVVTDHI